MTPAAIERAARMLLGARNEHRLIDGLPEDCLPATIEEAYAVQDRLLVLMDEDVGGWFLGCTNPAVQRRLGLATPYWARLLARAIHASPATLAARDFLSITLECEFAFRLGRDLPPRSEPYTVAEVAQATATVHPAIEVVTSHLRDWTEQPITALIADNGTDGALVLGAGSMQWEGLDLAAVAVALRVDGTVVRRGSGANVMGDPLAAFTWLANERARRGGGLRAGQVHNTGTSTEMVRVRPGCEAVADFAALGAVRVRLAA